jgi:hypothetical protein
MWRQTPFLMRHWMQMWVLLETAIGASMCLQQAVLHDRVSATASGGGIRGCHGRARSGGTGLQGQYTV